MEDCNLLNRIYQKIVLAIGVLEVVVVGQPVSDLTAIANLLTSLRRSHESVMEANGDLEYCRGLIPNAFVQEVLPLVLRAIDNIAHALTHGVVLQQVQVHHETDIINEELAQRLAEEEGRPNVVAEDERGPDIIGDVMEEDAMEEDEGHGRGRGS